LEIIFSFFQEEKKSDWSINRNIVRRSLLLNTGIPFGGFENRGKDPVEKGGVKQVRQRFTDIVL